MLLKSQGRVPCSCVTSRAWEAVREIILRCKGVFRFRVLLLLLQLLLPRRRAPNGVSLVSR